MAKVKSLISEAQQIKLASELIHMDARLQVLESETQLSRERLIRLYKEIKKKSPPKGMLPFSTDWFMTWQPNIHGSLFMNFYDACIKATDMDDGQALVQAYKMYREQITQLGLPEVLSMTRAWRLVKFFDAGMLTTAPCTCCGGRYVVHTYDLVKDYECGLCNVPSRAGKTKQDAATRFFNDEALVVA
ncbi:MAG TPA: flagellar transcriptional regulator FlhC [Limnobacter sp.]|uniref:flagellar transcriptional regulator FlhC n=1 Tax=Limnobacter sp. TaxID=2003368 RepID=UPI002ED8E216